MASQSTNKRVNIYLNTERSQKQLESLAKTTQKLESQLAKLPPESEKFAKTSVKLDATRKKYDRLAGVLSGEVKPNLTELKRLQRELNKEFANAESEAQQKKLAAQIAKVTSQIKAQKAMILDANKAYQQQGVTATASAGKASKGMRLMSMAGAGIKSMFAGLLPLMAGFFAVEKLIEFGAEILNIEKNFNALKNSVQTYAKISGKALNDTAIKINSISKAFNVTTDEVLTSANTLQKQLGVSFGEASQIIEESLANPYLNSEGKRQDFLNEIKEYAPQFKAAGISAEAMAAELIRAKGEGVYSDKGADAIKEFGLRIREQTNSTRDALQGAFGAEFTNTLFKNINNGSMTTAEALQTVSKKMNDTQLPADKLGTVLADVFGGAGEDAGLEYIYSLQNMATSLEDVTNKTSKAYLANQQKLALTKRLSSAESELAAKFEGTNSVLDRATLITKTFALEAVNVLIDGFKFLWDAAKPIRLIFEALQTEIKAMFLEFQKLGKELNLFSNSGEATTTIFKVLTSAVSAIVAPLRLVIKTITGVVSWFTELYKSSEVVRGVLGGLAGAIGQVFANIAENISNFNKGFTEIIKGIQNLDFEKITGGIGKMFESVKNQAFSGGKDAGEAFMQGYAAQSDKARKAEKKKQLKSYRDFYENLPAQTQKATASQPTQPRPAPTSQTSAGGGMSLNLSEKADTELEKWQAFQSEIEQYRAALESKNLSANERELAEIDKKYERLRQKYAENEKALAEIDEVYKNERQAKINEQNAAEKQAKQQFQEEITQMEMTDREREIEKTREKYTKLKEQAEQFGLETKNIAELQKRELLEISQKYNQKELADKKATEEKKLATEKRVFDARQQMLSKFSGLAGNLAEMLAQNGGELAGFQKGLALTQIAIDTATALSSAIAGATAAAAASGPGAPFVIAGYIASMVGTVLGAFASAKKTLAKAKEPEAPKIKKGFAEGGATLDSVSAGGYVGKKTATFGEHGTEYVVPNWLLSNPYVANEVAQMEAIRQTRTPYYGYAEGGATNTKTAEDMTATTNEDFTVLISEVRGLRADLTTFPKSLKAYLVYSELQEFETEATDLEQNAGI